MKYLILVLLIAISKLTFSQACFDAYDLLFAEENKSLTYNEFHKLELEFLANLNGCEAVDFNLTTLEENEILLSSLKGKVVVLNFWFTTCLPCLKEIPQLNKLVHDFDADEVVFIGLARDTESELSAFFNKFGPFHYQIVPESYKLADEYRVVGWPQSMVIDKNGKIFKSWAGLGESPSILKNNIESAIRECLNQ